MSDPSSRSEIQDVLSSIRRLVSEDNRRTDGGAAAKTADTGEPGKLVLTPAHRIDDDTTSGGVAAKASLEDTIAELEAAVSGSGGEFEPDGSEIAKTDGPAGDPDLERAFETGFAVDTGVEGETTDLSHPVTADRLDDGGDDDGACAPTEPDAAAEDAASAASLTAAAEDDRDDRETPASGDAGLNAASAGAAGAATARRLHLAAQDMVSDSRAPWGRLDAPDKTSEDESQTPPLAQSTALDAEAEADAALLREIVSDIVRQELQGPLGERITRSVRMLVRREINRALASRGIE